MPINCAEFEAIAAAVRASGWRRIGIDGVDGVGKSHLAAQLASTLSWAVIDVDDFLQKHQGGYAGFVDYPALQLVIASHEEAVITGVCLRQILSHAGCEADAYVYVKRMRNGLWSDEDECVFPEGLPAALEKFKRDCELIARFIGDGSDDLPRSADERSTFAEEIMRYHDAYRPHELADIVYERSDYAI